jgi:hypothetical protein
VRNVSETDRATYEAEAEAIGHWSLDDRAAAQDAGVMVLFTPVCVYLSDIRNSLVPVETVLKKIQSQVTVYPFSKLHRMIVIQKLLNPNFEIKSWWQQVAR